MTRKATTFRIDAPAQAALENLSRVLKCPMNQLVNEAVKDYLERRSREVERDLEATLSGLRAYSQRDPDSKKAGAAFVDAEAQLGKSDPAEGKVTRGKLVGGQLIEEQRVESARSPQAEISRLLNAGRLGR